MKTTIPYFTIYFTYILADRHCSMKTNVSHKVGYYHSHVSRRDFSRLYSKAITWKRNGSHGTRKQKTVLTTKTFSVWVEQSGSPMALSSPGEIMGVAVNSQQSTRELRGAQCHSFLCDIGDSSEILGVCMQVCCMSLSLSFIDNDFSVTF